MYQVGYALAAFIVGIIIGVVLSALALCKMQAGAVLLVKQNLGK